MTKLLEAPTTRKSTRPLKFDATLAETQSRFERAAVLADRVAVKPMGGRFAAGVLYGVSLISRGEALGHGFWIDDVTLDQVAEFASSDSSGVKSRFTHPSMSSDGLGRHLGRIFSSERSDDRVVGDLHFARIAHSTPEGNLAEYVMTLAEEDAAAAGLSIVFEHDREQEVDFLLAHGAEQIESDGFSFIDLANFVSPDELNVNNYPHVRLANLRAADVVDEPAANPAGLFDRQPQLRQLDQFLSFAFGVSDERPTEDLPFSVDVDRASLFLSRWLSSHSLELSSTKKESDSMTTEAPAVEQQADDSVTTREQFLADLKKFTDAFGVENGTAWFNEGVEFNDALGKHCEQLAERVEQLTAENAELQKRLDDIALGEDEPLELASGKGKKKTHVSDFYRKNKPSNIDAEQN
jgi:hypothetical protein